MQLTRSWHRSNSGRFAPAPCCALPASRNAAQGGIVTDEKLGSKTARTQLVHSRRPSHGKVAHALPSGAGTTFPSLSNSAATEPPALSGRSVGQFGHGIPPSFPPPPPTGAFASG